MTNKKSNLFGASAFIEEITNHLFRNEEQRLTKKEISLVQQNREISSSEYDGFFFKGKYYTNLDRALAHKGIKSGLHPSLVPIMEAHLIDKKQVAFDKLRIKQALAVSLKDCRTPQDLRDSLPNALVEMVPALRTLPRTRPEAFLLQDDPRKQKQYEKLREKIEFYVAARLLY